MHVNDFESRWYNFKVMFWSCQLFSFFQFFFIPEFGQLQGSNNNAETFFGFIDISQF